MLIKGMLFSTPYTQSTWLFLILPQAELLKSTPQKLEMLKLHPSSAIVRRSISRYFASMPRHVTYQILDTPDGCFAVAATIEPDKTSFRTGFATHAEAEEWIEGLREIMAALGAPVSLAFPDHPSPVSIDELLARSIAGT